MAKRKRLAPPSAEELAEMEADFAPKSTLGAMAPIAQVAGDAAAHGSALTAGDRAAAAQDQADAEAYRKAAQSGGLIFDVPLAQIDADQMTRDRMSMTPEEMDELKTSIRQHGVRLPIEIFESRDQSAAARYGLLSGYRRLFVVRELFAETQSPEFATIRAVVKEPAGLADAITAMVEENEIRSGLSHYERGRIAALATHQGAFDAIDEAVNALYFAASKAKRSKVRSFAMIHEELGDLLTFPQGLTERMGLRLANALRAGLTREMREALATGQGVDPATEWALLEPWVGEAEADQKSRRRRGGPRRAGTKPKPVASKEYHLDDGRSLVAEHDGSNYVLRFKGQAVSPDLMDAVAAEIAKVLRKH